MNVRIVPRWDADSVDVYVWEKGVGANRLLRFLIDEEGNQNYRWDELPPEPTAGVKPSLVLPHDVLRLLVGEANDYLPPSAATDLALKDAKEVRDRLLSLVEHTMKSS
jgi:hypothetical protein